MMQLKQLWETGYFLRSLRARVKYGEFSRAPLCLLRLEVRDGSAERHCLSRPPDLRHSAFPRQQRQQSALNQALRDASGVSGLLFATLQDVREAQFRAFGQSAREPPRLILTGKPRREAPPVLKVSFSGHEGEDARFSFPA